MYQYTRSRENIRGTLRDNIIYLFGEFSQKELMHFRKIPGNMAWGNTKKVPCNTFNIGMLRELNVELSESILQWEREHHAKEVNITLPENLELYPYQKEGVRLLEEKNGKALLADQPRLGKTIQVIAYLLLHRELRPALIVVPASVKIQWAREIKKWSPEDKVTIINGMSMRIPKEGIVIMNYDLLWNYYNRIEENNFTIIVADECHKVKNISAKRSKAFKYLSRGIEHIIGLSGTPISNRPSEFFTILNAIDPKLFNSQTKYLEEYCNIKRDPSGKGASNTEKLNKLLKETIMIRRLRSEVWQDIPEKQRVIIPVEIDNRAEYKRAEDDLIQYLRETKGNRAAANAIRSQALAKFNVMKDIAARGKLLQAVDWIENFIEAEKLVVFCSHRKMVEEIDDSFSKNSVKLYGGMSNKQKDDAVNKFNNDPNIDVFVGNLLAAGVGLPLHVADATLTLEFDWVPANHEQAEDRVVNKDKLHTPITAYYMVAVNTIEEDIAAIIDRKSIVLSKILDGKEVDQESLLTVLIEKYSKL